MRAARLFAWMVTGIVVLLWPNIHILWRSIHIGTLCAETSAADMPGVPAVASPVVPPPVSHSELSWQQLGRVTPVDEKATDRHLPAIPRDVERRPPPEYAGHDLFVPLAPDPEAGGLEGQRTQPAMSLPYVEHSQIESFAVPTPESWPIRSRQPVYVDRPKVLPPPEYRVITEFKWGKVVCLFVDVDCDDIVDFYCIKPKLGPEVWYDIDEFSGQPAMRPRGYGSRLTKR